MNVVATDTAAAIAAVGRALPPHRYEQEELIAAARALWKDQHANAARVDQLHRAVQVGGRNLALPLERYAELKGFGDANDAFIGAATDLAEAALREALDAAGLAPRDLDALFFVTVTGVAAPTIDARLMNRMKLRPDVKRVPIFGLGCVAGAAGTARVADYLRGFPDHVAALVSVELCSLTLQRGDLSVANLIASGLFGDAAAALVAVGAERADAAGVRIAGPRVVASRSSFYPDTERVMGWDIGSSGFKVILAQSVPDVVRANIGRDVDAFLADHGLERGDIRSWVCHPGGPKVLEAFQEALGLGPRELDVTWRSLREVGNLSSASVLHVMAETMATRRPPAGSPGLMIAMGPGFCSELVLLQW